MAKLLSTKITTYGGYQIMQHDYEGNKHDMQIKNIKTKDVYLPIKSVIYQNTTMQLRRYLKYLLITKDKLNKTFYIQKNIDPNDDYINISYNDLLDDDL